MHCRARDDLEEERLARIDSDDAVLPDHVIEQTSEGHWFPDHVTERSGFHCRARDDLEEERLARIDAEDVVFPLIMSLSNRAFIAGQEMT